MYLQPINLPGNRQCPSLPARACQLCRSCFGPPQNKGWGWPTTLWPTVATGGMCSTCLEVLLNCQRVCGLGPAHNGLEASFTAQGLQSTWIGLIVCCFACVYACHNAACALSNRGRCWHACERGDTGMGGTPASTGEGRHLVWCCTECNCLWQVPWLLHQARYGL